MPTSTHARRSVRAPNPAQADEVSALVKRYISRSAQTGRSLLVIDSSETFRVGLRSAIAATSQLVIIGESESAAALRAQRLPDHIDVAIVDVDLRDQNFLLVCQWLMAQRPSLATVFLSFRDWDIYLASAQTLGSAGLLLRWTSTRQLVEALVAAADGPLFTSEQSARVRTWNETIGKPLQALSLREWSLLWLLADGTSYHEISRRLALSQNTIERHASSLLNKLSLSSSRQLQSFVHTHHLEVLRGLDFDTNPFSAGFKGVTSVADP